MIAKREAMIMAILPVILTTTVHPMEVIVGRKLENGVVWET